MLAAEPYPGAVETVRALARGRPLHPHHLAPRRRGATGPPPWLDRIGLPYDELYCSYDKVARCGEIGIDLLIDDSPENLERAIDAGIAAATLLHPGTASCARPRTSICGDGLGRSSARALEPVLAMTQLPAPSRRDLRDHLPAIEPERQVSDWGRSERVEGLLDKTLY